MSIVSFWSNGKNETGKSSSIVSIATHLAVQHNYKILILDTKHNDYFYQYCYWKQENRMKLFNRQEPKFNIESGIDGLAKAILSNKTAPEIVTNYTRIVFSDNRLEVLSEASSTKNDYDVYKKIFKDIAKIANKYYDLVFIDIDTDLDEDTKNSILEVSDLVLVSMSQRKKQIDDYIKIKKDNLIFQDKPKIIILGRYDKNSKYSAKNISRYIGEKEIPSIIPYNTLFFEACNDSEVDDFFIKFRNINQKDKNAFFFEEVNKVSEKIIYKLKELQVRI